MRPTPTLALLLALACAGCGTAGSEQASEKTTYRALAAAVIAHVDQKVSAAAPLFPGDYLDGDVRLARGDMAVEVAFHREGHDATHVRVVVEHAPGPAPACDREFYRDRCTTGTVGDRSLLFAWSPGDPQEDPGNWDFAARQGDTLVTLTAHGPLIEGDPRKGDLSGFTKRLRAIVTDPAVGFRTTPDDIAAGKTISDEVWLDWYGQGNGYPRPPGYQPT